MSEFKDYVYIRTDPAPIDSTADPKRRRWASDLAKTRAHLSKARKEGFECHRRRVVTERVSVAVAASGRPKFMQLLRKLGPETGLVVWHLDGLGRDASDVLKTIRKVGAQGAEIYCMALSSDELGTSKDLIAMLEQLAQLERRTAKLREMAHGAGRGVAGGRIGRPPSLDEATRAKVKEGLKAGETVSALARRHNTSRQTILRIRCAEE